MDVARWCNKCIGRTGWCTRRLPAKQRVTVTWATAIWPRTGGERGAPYRPLITFRTDGTPDGVRYRASSSFSVSQSVRGEEREQSPSSFCLHLIPQIRPTDSFDVSPPIKASLQSWDLGTMRVESSKVLSSELQSLGRSIVVKPPSGEIDPVHIMYLWAVCHRTFSNALLFLFILYPDVFIPVMNIACMQILKLFWWIIY